VNPRPRSITIISWLFIVLGIVSLVHGLMPGRRVAGSDTALSFGHLLAHTLHLLALVGGAFLLRGRNWARWLLTGWMAIHIVIGFAHGLGPTLMHLGIFGWLTYLLFRPGANAFFGGSRAGPLPN
jgi:hypothetical protein